MCPCSSRAAWYSAFSLRSPISRAVAMRLAISIMSTFFMRSSSPFFFSYPSRDMGMRSMDMALRLLAAGSAAGKRQRRENPPAEVLRFPCYLVPASAACKERFLGRTRRGGLRRPFSRLRRLLLRGHARRQREQRREALRPLVVEQLQVRLICQPAVVQA